MPRFRLDRRAVLGAFAAVPGLRLLVPMNQTIAADSAPARDVIRELGVRPCINAAGTYTALTGSLTAVLPFGTLIPALIGESGVIGACSNWSGCFWT